MENSDLPPLVLSSPASSSKKPFIIAAVVCFVILIISIIVYIVLNQKSISIKNPLNPSNNTTRNASATSQKNRPSTKPSGTNSSSPDSSSTAPAKQDVSILLIRKSDMDAMKKDYQNKLREKGLPVPTPIKYNFKFQLSPELKSPQSFNNLFPGYTVYSANACNLFSVPSSVYVYVLRSHIAETQANEEAAKFNLNPPAYSSGPDAGTFSYQYQDLSTTNPRYFNMTESSGVYKFHDAATPSGSLISEANAKTVSQAELSKLGLSGLFSFDSIDSLSVNHFILKYKKTLEGLTVIDEDILKTLPGAKSVCDIGTGAYASEMSFIDTQISKKGGIISGFANSTRLTLSKTKVNRQTLEKSLSEYSDPNSYITPIIISQGGAATSGTVVIDEAYVAYYDLGSLAAQALYIPMYVASGKIGTTRVFTIVPAVPLSDIPQLNEIASLNTQNTVKQTDIPFSQPIPPPFATGSGTIKCPGGFIDRIKKCVCNGHSKTFPMKSIPSETCPATCTQQQTTETIDGESCTCTIMDCPC